MDTSTGAAGLMKSLKDSFEHISWTRGVSTRKVYRSGGFSMHLLVLGDDDDSIGVEIAENRPSLYRTCDPLGGGRKEKVT